MKARNFASWAVAIVVFFTLTIFLSTPGKTQAAEKVTKWKCQVLYPNGSISFKEEAQVFVDEIKERTKGRLIIELYAADALVPSKEIFNAVKRGMVEIGDTSPAYFTDQVPLGAFSFGLPLNFRDTDEGVYFAKWMGFEKMMKDACAKHGVLYSTGKIYPVELALKKPVNRLADLKGLKIRSTGLLQNYLSALGAAASYIPAAEVYSALVSGVIDGAHWGASQGNDSMKFYDACKYHLKTALCVSNSDDWIVNQKAVDALPEDVRRIFLAALEERFWKRNLQYNVGEKVTLKRLQRENGVKVTYIPPEDHAEMLKVATKLWDDFAKKGPELAKAVEMLKEYNKSLGR